MVSIPTYAFRHERSNKRHRSGQGCKRVSLIPLTLSSYPGDCEERAAEHQAPARLPRGPAGAARLAHHLLLRRQGVARAGRRGGRAARRAAADRPPRGRDGGELSRGHGGAQGVVVLPAQRERRDVRAGGLRAGAPDREGPLGGRAAGGSCTGAVRRAVIRVPDPAGSTPPATRTSADAP